MSEDEKKLDDEYQVYLRAFAGFLHADKLSYCDGDVRLDAAVALAALNAFGEEVHLNSRARVPTVPPGKMRPQGSLRGKVPKPPPAALSIFDRIGQLPDAEISSAVDQVLRCVGPAFSWAESSVLTLKHRRDRLRHLVKEVWQ